MKITVKVATTETVSESVHFDENALLALENTAVGTPVIENFDFDKKVGARLSFRKFCSTLNGRKNTRLRTSYGIAHDLFNHRWFCYFDHAH